MHRTLASGLLLLLSLSLLPASANAQQTDEDLAQRYYKLGEELYNRSDYEGALKQFEQAHKYAPKPALLFNIARCQESLGRHEKAIETFKAYLVSGPDNAEQVKARIANLERLVAKKREAHDPPPAPAAGGEPTAAPSPSIHRGSWPAWVVTGSGVALLGAGVVFGALAGGKSSDLEQANDAGKRFSDVRSDLDSGETFETMQVIMLIAGGVAAATGGVLLFLHYRHPSAERQTAWIAPLISEGGALVAGGLRF